MFGQLYHLYILSNGTIAPVVHIYLKPIYSMLSLTSDKVGQPLERIRVITVPNGLLLIMNPNYLKLHPDLSFPGKDNKVNQQENSVVGFHLIY
ncbi:BglI family type II restriction endonuclease [Radiobacillus kanasensis]|nr:BglI family type II restriction endonuclease [Radiobacillus kanasensis]UFU00169.1 BglI family type II restriction endonuclease [Radiobacillus kanasensis]